ncbi:MAG: T9SS type A sorting domain-containing protein [Ignavibacteriae bacterium]|nr:T9SS type A sorting domain-containing protein [Ignavibacteriota bacterium]
MGESLYVGTPVGVYRSVNGGNQWTQINIGLSGNQDVESFAVVGSVLFAGTYGSGVFRSTNGGDLWEPANAGIANRVVRCLAATAAGLFAGSDSGLFRSVDGGSAWQRTSLGWQQEAILHLWPDGYEAGQGYAVALSADGNTAILGGPYHARGAGGAWVFHRENGIWQSDGGGHMSGLGATNAPGYGYSVALSLDGKTAAFGGVSDEAGRGSSWVFSRTQDGWSQVGGKLVGTSGSARPGQGAAIALSGDGSTVIVGGPGDDSIGGAWLFTSTMTGIIGQGGERPLTFSLAQNYPNPFNPETTIEFDVASETRVDIAVYDVLGRMVADLVGEVKQPGHYLTRFNKAGLSSGVYFCRMHAGRFVQVRKRCLMR